VKNYWHDSNLPDGSSVATWFVEIAIRVAQHELSGNGVPACSPHHIMIGELLRHAVTSEPRGPDWFPYVESCLHMSERLLGMELKGPVGKDRRLQVTLARRRSRVCGAYATPGSMTEALIADVFATVTRDGAVSILDLSVEAGQLPISALAFAPTKRPVKFFGIDRDPEALRLTRSLYRFAQKHAQNSDFELSLTCRDSLLEPLPSDWPRQFDIIIGNPPWAARLGGYTEEVREHFRPWLTGNFDLYLAFVLRADSLLKPGGCLGVIIPSTFLFNDSCQSVRKHLLAAYDVVCFRIYPRGSFVEVRSIVPILLVLRKKKTPAQGESLTHITYPEAAFETHECPAIDTHSYAARYWRTLQDSPFHPWVRPETTSVMGHLAGFARLADFGTVLPGIGLRAGSGLAANMHFIGFQARDLRPFHACTRNSRSYNGTLPFRECPKAGDVSLPKVLFQNFRFLPHSRRLIAAATGPGAYGVSTASMFIPEDHALTDFFAAVMNSAVANVWFKLRDVSRAIKLRVVREIPVGFEAAFVTEVTALAKECRRMKEQLHVANNVCSASSPKLESQGDCKSTIESIASAERRLDSIFFDLFRLSRRQRALIRDLAERRVF
jgi:tRNA1(Val) A37 N6-methylase TrmN6